MQLIIRQCFSLGGRTPEAESIISDAKIWAKALFEFIPGDRLLDSFDKALILHGKSPHPVNAYELKYAYEVLKTEEAEEKAEREAIEAELSPIENCIYRKSHLIEDANDNGMTESVNPFDPQEDIIIPCQNCRRAAFDQAHAKLAKKYGRSIPPRLELAAKMKAVDVDVKNPIAVMDALITTAFAKWKSINNHDKENLDIAYSFWKKMLRIKKYIQSKGEISATEAI